MRTVECPRNRIVSPYTALSIRSNPPRRTPTRPIPPPSPGRRPLPTRTVVNTRRHPRPTSAAPTTEPTAGNQPQGQDSATNPPHSSPSQQRNGEGQVIPQV